MTLFYACHFAPRIRYDLSESREGVIYPSLWFCEKFSIDYATDIMLALSVEPGEFFCRCVEVCTFDNRCHKRVYLICGQPVVFDFEFKEIKKLAEDFLVNVV